MASSAHKPELWLYDSLVHEYDKKFNVDESNKDRESTSLRELFEQHIMEANLDAGLLTRFFHGVPYSKLLQPALLDAFSTDLEVRISEFKSITVPRDQYGHESGSPTITDEIEQQKLAIFVQVVIQNAYNNLFDSAGFIREELLNLLNLDKLPDIDSEETKKRILKGYVSLIIQGIFDKGKGNSPAHQAALRFAMKNIDAPIDKVFKEKAVKEKNYPLQADGNPNATILHYLRNGRRELKKELTPAELKVYQVAVSKRNHPTPRRAREPTVLFHKLRKIIDDCPTATEFIAKIKELMGRLIKTSKLERLAEIAPPSPGSPMLTSDSDSSPISPSSANDSASPASPTATSPVTPSSRSRRTS